MLYTANMSAKPVQVSIDENLLQRIDRDPEARRSGRSAFLRHAAELYLRAKRRRSIDASIRQAYGGREAALQQEIEGLMEVQAWPDE